jgi:hypothetical protein
MKFGRIGSEKNNKIEAQKRERKIAKEFGGRATPNSGATDMAKGDVSFPKYLLDDKFTSGDAYSVTIADISKITREAYAVSKEPIFSVCVRKGISKGYPTDWILIPKHLLELSYMEVVEGKGKSILLSAQILNNIYKKALKAQCLPCSVLQFFNVPLGVPNQWYLLPFDELDKDFLRG